MPALGERQIVIDCDVLQADGGTRTAAITGGYVALAQCASLMQKTGLLKTPLLKDHVAAISCGIVKGEALLDLDYDEDSTAETDANFVLTGAGGLVEIQGTAEGAPFSEEQLTQLLRLARKGIGELVELQKQALLPWTKSVKLPRGSLLVVASHNQGKVREIKALLGPHGIEPVSAGELSLPEPEETGATFIANAELKARAAADASGHPALADDSGLWVDALDGDAGNLFGALGGTDQGFPHRHGAGGKRIAGKKRHGFFRQLCLRLSSPCRMAKSEVLKAKCMASSPFRRAATLGFGYDPIFIPDGWDQTSAKSIRR